MQKFECKKVMFKKKRIKFIKVTNACDACLEKETKSHDPNGYNNTFEVTG
jgi:hypothetical protein